MLVIELCCIKDINGLFQIEETRYCVVTAAGRIIPTQSNLSLYMALACFLYNF